MTRIKSAIIPAAGLGTRMRPATNAVPKELLPVGGRPAIDWVVEEACLAGIEEIVVVSSPRKPAIEAYLLTGTWSQSAHPGVTEQLGGHALADDVLIRVVHQLEPRGLGDAVLVGARACPDASVAVLLPDDLISDHGELLRAMIECHERSGQSVVSVMSVEREEIGAYGCAVLGKRGPDGERAVLELVEKPDPELAPSTDAVAGRYVLGAQVLRALESIRPDGRGEVQLTAALDLVAQRGQLTSVELRERSQRIDIGNWSGWLEANLQLLGDGNPPTPRWRIASEGPKRLARAVASERGAPAGEHPSTTEVSESA